MYQYIATICASFACLAADALLLSIFLLMFNQQRQQRYAYTDLLRNKPE